MNLLLWLAIIKEDRLNKKDMQKFDIDKDGKVVTILLTFFLVMSAICLAGGVEFTNITVPAFIVASIILFVYVMLKKKSKA